MCNFNPNCSETPGVVVTIGPTESIFDCCGVVVDLSHSPSDTENETASP
ncbi:hypothetical protein [Halogranum rubrum]|uniref:Uncharacterized protein n=1 Tax=Halogranum salarium B-1 TaxID=1210908 RepID=J3A5Q7_9EURY|nr:hypothetical protein [Halogranum salarium]EJN60788.1 hypothetical protein HSB1_13910 [Halogranum salarium B-1]